MNKMEPIRAQKMIVNLADYYLQFSSRTDWIRKRNHAFFMMSIFLKSQKEIIGLLVDRVYMKCLNEKGS